MNSFLSINGYDVGTVLSNFATSLPNLVIFVQVFAYLLGLIFIVTGALALKKHTDDPRGGHLNFAFWSIIFGATCLYLPTSITTSTETIFASGGNRLLDYYQPPQGMAPEVAAMLNVIYNFIQFIGLIAFIRGLMILRLSSKAGGASQGDTVGKGLIHVIGGTVAINLQTFVETMRQTFGF